MKKLNSILVSLLVPLLFLTFPIQLAEANPVGLFQGLPSITIQRDGSVTPQTDNIWQEGNIYYLTQNLSQSYRLIINCSNIIFDGQGHVINGSKRVLWGDQWLDSQCEGITIENVKNVTIKNVIIIGFYEPSICIDHCSNIKISNVQTDAKPTIAIDISGCIWIEESNSNTISHCITGLRLMSGSNNVFYENTLFLSIHSSNNSFFKNNIIIHYGSTGFKYPIIGGSSINSWDDGSIGNYWSDYIGQKVYEIDENNIDHYPLTQKVDIPLNTSPSSTVPELSLLAIIPLLFCLFPIAIFLRHQKTSK